MKEKLQSPGRSHILWSGQEVSEVMHAVITIFKKRFGDDAIKGHEQEISGALFFYYTFLEAQKHKETEDQTISLPKIFTHLERIKKLSQELAKELKWAYKNPTVKDALILCKGPSEERAKNEFFKDLFQTALPRVLSAALDIENTLPRKEDSKHVWPENPGSAAVLVQELVYAYKKTTGKAPWVIHDQDRTSIKDTYSGDFLELVSEVFAVIGETPPSPRHIQRIIKETISKSL